MKIRIFQSDKGDCLLLEGRSDNGQPGPLMLCDGGMGPSMRNFVRAELSKLRDDGRDIDLAYISHIDNDHINGILQLLEDEVDWRVFDFHEADGNPIDEPEAPRPPKINGLLHNSFRDQISKNQGSISGLAQANAIEQLLASMAPSFYATADSDLAELADEMTAISLGVPEAIKVSKLISADALDIPLNQPPGVAQLQNLLYAGRPGEQFTLGKMDFTLIGPTENELDDLRDGWNNFLRDNKEKIKELRKELKGRIDALGSSASSQSPFDLRDWNGIPDFKGVTIPNIASLMFMVEEKNDNGAKSSLLLTGDGQQKFILDGLRRTGFLDDNVGLHLDVLKVQHHGSEHNLDTNFARLVSADNYVFCADGEHENPDLAVLDIVFNSRMGKPKERALAAPANKTFHFWFSTTSEAQKQGTKKREYFRKVEKRVEKLAEKAQGKLKLHFNENVSITLKV
jgi:hypothetical protein